MSNTDTNSITDCGCCHSTGYERDNYRSKHEWHVVICFFNLTLEKRNESSLARPIFFSPSRTKTNAMLPFVGMGFLEEKKPRPSSASSPYILESFDPVEYRKGPDRCIVRGQYNIPKEKVEPAFFDTLTVRPFSSSEFQRPEPFPVFTIGQRFLRIPRTLGFQTYGVPIVKVEKGATTSYAFKATLRDYQTQAVDRVLREFAMGEGRDCMLEAGVGTGKTVMAICAMARFGRRAAVIVHKDFLMTQWRDRIRTFCPDAKVGLVQRDTCDYEDKDIVICMLHSIVQKANRYPSAFFASVGLVVVDECHHIAARTFSKVLRPFPASHRLGLTATAERKDRLTHVLHWLLGPTVFRIQRRAGAATTTKVPMVEQIQHKPTTWKEIRTKRGQILFTKMITKMVEDEDRNKMIATKVRALVEEGRRVLVVSDRRKHLSHLQQMLSDVPTAMYVGESTKKGKRKREDDKDKASVLFTTYMMGEEGLDLPFLDTLVMVTPRKSLEQIIGRILRKKDGKKVPLIVDVVDTVSIFYGMGRSRMRHYNEKKYKIVS